MAISITQTVNEVRLEALRAYLDTGADNAKVLVYAGQRAATVYDPPPPGSSLLLVTINLAKPCGLVSNGILELTQPISDMAMATGEPKWARVVTGDGATAFDVDAGGPNPEGYWEIKLSEEVLYAGGYVLLQSATIR